MLYDATGMSNFGRLLVGVKAAAATLNPKVFVSGVKPPSEESPTYSMEWIYQFGDTIPRPADPFLAMVKVGAHWVQL